MKRIDTTDIKAVVTCRAVLDHFGRKAVAGRFNCASPDHPDATPSMTLCHGDSGVKCHACQYGADCIKLYGDLSGLSGSDLFITMAEVFHIQPKGGQSRPSTRPNGSKVRQSPAGPKQQPPSKPKGEPMGEMKRTASYSYYEEKEDWEMEIQPIDADTRPGFGAEVLRIDRMEQSLRMPDGTSSKRKEFPFKTKDAAGNWQAGNGVSKRQAVVLPYAWARLLTAPPGADILLAEGEKDADNLNAAGFFATCVPGSQKSDWGGCGSGCLTKAQVMALARLNRRIVVIPDADKEGYRKAADNIRALVEMKDRGLVSLPVSFLDLGYKVVSKKDASDFLETRGAEALRLLLSKEKTDFDVLDWKDELKILDKMVSHFKASGGIHANE